MTKQEHALSLLKRFRLKLGKGNGEEDKIVLELIDGRREEMYWDGVPDKVRALAVQRAQQAHKTQRGETMQSGDQDDVAVGLGEQKPPRKRQRR